MPKKEVDSFFKTAKLVDICGLASIVHQWQCALHRNPIKRALLCDDSSIREPDMFKVDRAICSGQLILISVIKEIVAFFCTNSALAKKLNDSLAHKRGQSPYYSEIVHCGSDIGLLLYRLLAYTMETEAIKWHGQGSYRLTFKDDLPMCLNSALSRHEFADEIFVAILEGPRGGLDHVQEYFYYPALLMAESYCAYPNGIPTIRHLPKEPEMYPAKAKYTSISQQPKSFQKRKAEREAALAALPLEPQRVIPVLPQQVVEVELPAILTDANSLSGSVELDKQILLFATPSDLCAVRKASKYTHALVHTYFCAPLQWALDITKIISKYMSEERGKFHLLMETWGYEDVPEVDAPIENAEA